MPFWTVRERMALAMLALISVMTPSAASRSERASSRASSPITRRAATSSSDMLPPRKLPTSSRPSTTLASVTGRRATAVGCHDAQVGLEARGLDLRFQARHVVAHLGADEGVQRRRGEALELAELRRHRRGGGGEAVGIFLTHDRHGARLVRRIEVGEQEADGDGLDAGFLALAHGLANAFLVERLQHFAARRHQPLRHRLALPALDPRSAL